MFIDIFSIASYAITSLVNMLLGEVTIRLAIHFRMPIGMFHFLFPEKF